MARPDKVAAVAELAREVLQLGRRRADRVPRTLREGAQGAAPLTGR